jgi:hypothetical protein
MEKDCGHCGGVVFDGRVGCQFARAYQPEAGIQGNPIDFVYIYFIDVKLNTSFQNSFIFMSMRHIQ